MSTLPQQLAVFGLSESDVAVYVLLNTTGEMTVGDVINATPRGRTTVYDAINTLEERGLVTTRKQGRNVFVLPAHPQQFAELLEDHTKEQRQFKRQMESTIAQLTASYNLSVGKPGVQFFEGAEGFNEVLHHSLQATDTIYSFVNSDNVDAFASEIDTNYVRNRIKKGIKKQIIMADTPGGRAYVKKMNQEYTEVKFISQEEFPFETALEIYDNTISYLTMDADTFIAFLISHPGAAQLHKSTFKLLWSLLD